MNIMVVQEENSGDHQSYYDSSSGHHIYCIWTKFHDSSSNVELIQSGSKWGHTNAAICRATLVAWLKILFLRHTSDVIITENHFHTHFHSSCLPQSFYTKILFTYTPLISITLYLRSKLLLPQGLSVIHLST